MNLLLFYLNHLEQHRTLGFILRTLVILALSGSLYLLTKGFSMIPVIDIDTALTYLQNAQEHIERYSFTKELDYDKVQGYLDIVSTFFNQTKQKDSTENSAYGEGKLYFAENELNDKTEALRILSYLRDFVKPEDKKFFATRIVYPTRAKQEKSTAQNC